jgi:hypothetical protein
MGLYHASVGNGMAPHTAEARVHPRTKARIRVEYHFGSTAGVGSTNDISEGGIWLDTKNTAEPGTRIYLRVYLPGSMSGEALQIIGMVKRSEALNPDAKGMGIHFEVAYSKTRALLSDFMHTMLLHSQPPPPMGDDGEPALHSHRFPALEGHEHAETMSPAEVRNAFAFATPIEEPTVAWGAIGGFTVRLLIVLVTLSIIAYFVMMYVAP